MTSSATLPPTRLTFPSMAHATRSSTDSHADYGSESAEGATTTAAASSSAGPVRSQSTPPRRMAGALARRRNQCRGLVQTFQRSTVLLHKALALLLCCVLIMTNDKAAAASSATESSDSTAYSNQRRTAGSSPTRSSPKTASPPAGRSAPASASSASASSRVPPVGTGSLDSSRLNAPHSVTYYETLLVSSAASAADIKQSHRRLAIRYHPDKFQAAEQGNSGGGKQQQLLGSKSLGQSSGLSKLQAQNMFISIQEAYECLSNPMERKRYDYALRTRTRYKKLAGPAATAADEAEPASPAPAPSTTTAHSSNYSTAYSTVNSTAYSTAHSTRRNSRQGDEAPPAGSSSSSTASSRPRRTHPPLTFTGLLLLPLVLVDVFLFKPLKLSISSRLPSLPTLPSPLGILRRLTKILALIVYLSVFIPVNCFVLANAMRRSIGNIIRGEWTASEEIASASTPTRTRTPQPYASNTTNAATTTTSSAAASPLPSPTPIRPSFTTAAPSYESSGVATTSGGSSESSASSSPSLSTSPSTACMAEVISAAALLAANSTKPVHSLSDAEEGWEEGEDAESTRPVLASQRSLNKYLTNIRPSASMPNFAAEVGQRVEW